MVAKQVTSRARQAKNVARALWQAGCIQIHTRPYYTWASGLRSPIYADNRLLLSDVAARDVVLRASLARLKLGPQPQVIAGVATSGIPMATLIAHRLKKPLVYVRPAPKGHGRGRQIEGTFKKGARVLLVEDLVSTGSSSLEAARALRRGGARLSQVLCTFAYLPQQCGRSFARARLPLVSLCDAETLLTVGIEGGYIGPRHELAARSFLEKLKKHFS